MAVAAASGTVRVSGGSATIAMNVALEAAARAGLDLSALAAGTRIDARILSLTAGNLATLLATVPMDGGAPATATITAALPDALASARAGTTLALIVEATAQGKILRLVEPPSLRAVLPSDATPAPALTPMAVARSALTPRAAQWVAVQTPSAALFALARTAKPLDIAPPLRDALARLSALPLPVEDVTGPSLESALRRSGPFLEAMLAKSAPAAEFPVSDLAPDTPPRDLKALLLGLRTIIGMSAEPSSDREKPAPANAGRPPLRGELPAPCLPVSVMPDRASTTSPVIDKPPPPDAVHLMSRAIADAADGVLARIGLMQLASLNEPGTVRAQTITELPLALPDGRTLVIPMQVLRESDGTKTEEDGHTGQGHDDPGRVWRIRFAVEHATAGPVDVLVTWRAGRVSVALWASDPVTYRRIDAAIGGLARTLADGDLDVVDLSARHGRAPADAGQLQGSAREPTAHFVDARS